MSAPTGVAATIALSGVLDEISNVPGAVTNYLTGVGRQKGGVTTRPVLFALYQTGMHGPQNGFRLILVKEGCKPEQVDVVLQGFKDIDTATADMVVVDAHTCSIVEENSN